MPPEPICVSLSCPQEMPVTSSQAQIVQCIPAVVFIHRSTQAITLVSYFLTPGIVPFAVRIIGKRQEDFLTEIRRQINFFHTFQQFVSAKEIRNLYRCREKFAALDAFQLHDGPEGPSHDQFVTDPLGHEFISDGPVHPYKRIALNIENIRGILADVPRSISGHLLNVYDQVDSRLPLDIFSCSAARTGDGTKQSIRPPSSATSRTVLEPK